MDPVLQAFSGLMMDNKGEDGIPHRVPFVVIDMSTALYAFQALSAALYARRDETRGRRIEVSLLQAAGMIQAIRMMMVYLEGEKVRRAMPSGVFKTADGWLQFLVVRDDAVGRVLHRYLGAAARTRSPLCRRRCRACTTRRSCSRLVRPAIAEHPTAYWAERLHQGRHHARAAQRLPRLPAPSRRPRPSTSSAGSTPAGAPEPVPVPNIAGSAPFADGTPRATTPVPGQHTDRHPAPARLLRGRHRRADARRRHRAGVGRNRRSRIAPSVATYRRNSGYRLICALPRGAEELQQQPRGGLGLLLLHPVSCAVDEMQCPASACRRSTACARARPAPGRCPSRSCPR